MVPGLARQTSMPWRTAVATRVSAPFIGRPLEGAKTGAVELACSCSLLEYAHAAHGCPRFVTPSTYVISLYLQRIHGLAEPHWGEQ